MRFLCLFSSRPLLSESCFADSPAGWKDRAEAGPCDFVPRIFDDDSLALAASGLFSAATVLLVPEDLASIGGSLGRQASSFERPGLSFELITARNPVEAILWFSRNAPHLLFRLRQDGEVHPLSPGWWRQRAELHRTRAMEAISPAPTEESESELHDLSAFLQARRTSRAG